MDRKQGHYRAHTPDHGLTCQYLYDTLGVEMAWEAKDHYQKRMMNRDSSTYMTLFLNTVLMRNKGDKDMQSKPETRSH